MWRPIVLTDLANPTPFYQFVSLFQNWIRVVEQSGDQWGVIDVTRRRCVLVDWNPWDVLHDFLCVTRNVVNRGRRYHALLKVCFRELKQTQLDHHSVLHHLRRRAAAHFPNVRTNSGNGWSHQDISFLENPGKRTVKLLLLRECSELVNIYPRLRVCRGANACIHSAGSQFVFDSIFLARNGERLDQQISCRGYGQAVR
jgi:hypothetical protein